MHYLYVLKSVAYDRHYIGITNNLQIRIDKHNSSSVRSTKAYRPWILAHSEAFQNKKEARRRELFLKKTSQAREELFKKINMAPSSSLV